MPLANGVPPVNAAYQEIVPALAVALSVTAPLPQLEPGVVDATVGLVFTVTVVTALDVHPFAFAPTTV